MLCSQCFTTLLAVMLDRFQMTQGYRNRSRTKILVTQHARFTLWIHNATPLDKQRPHSLAKVKRERATLQVAVLVLRTLRPLLTTKRFVLLLRSLPFSTSFSKAFFTLCTSQWHAVLTNPVYFLRRVAQPTPVVYLLRPVPLHPPIVPRSLRPLLFL